VEDIPARPEVAMVVVAEEAMVVVESKSPESK
jgi:hypothetical protein